MKRQIKVLVYDKTSISGKAIARFLKGKNRVLSNSTTFKTTKPTVLVNWGFRGSLGSNFIKPNIKILNKPSSIELASNKLKCLTKLEDNDVLTLAFASNINDARELFEDDNKVYCRTKLNSHSGKGIVIASNASELVPAGLYTQEFKNDIEYRVHVFKDSVIDIQQKKRMTSERLAEKGITVVKDNVRNLMNGWSFTREDIQLKDTAGNFITELITTPIEALKALDLDFGAVDLAYNSETNEVVIIEVNTAAGQKVKTTTNYNYVKAILGYAEHDIDLGLYNERWGCELTPINNQLQELKQQIRNN